MAQASILNTVTNITGTLVYPTISAGADRKALLAVEYYHGSSNVVMPTTVTIGGVTATIEAGLAAAASSARLGIIVYSLNESQIAAMVGSAVVITGGTFNERLVLALSVQNVQQVTNTSSGLYSSSGSFVTSGAVAGLVRTAESFSFQVAIAGTLTTATLSNPSNTTVISGSNFRATLGYANDTARTADASFTVTSSRMFSVAINFNAAPSQIINTVNGGAAVKVGSSFSSSVTGFTGASSGTIGGKALTGLNYSSNTITATAPTFVDGATFYQPGTNQTLTYINGAESASLVIPTSPPEGMTSVVIASPITADSTYIGSVYTLANGDRWVYPTLGGDFEVGADGKITATNEGAYVCWHWKASNSIMTEVTLIVNEAGAIVGSATGLTTSGLTISGLTTSGLTS